ncbi:antibiotic biosynthesis monooxygenase family protein [Streptomyces cinereospinus]|uniref:Antibiotic biosynthesis monooxygenase family protein n=1 Tax=Streptomyces cinereospinus TaxID=285561 RepID=A0ABV5N784_9ACTN
MDTPPSGEGPVTFINIIDIAEDEIDTFVSRWKERSRFTTPAEGFISAELFRALDTDTRFKVVNITKWESRAHFQAAIQAPDFRAELDGYEQSSTWTPHRGFYGTAAKFD